MARKRDRVFAMTLAIVFFITAFGFSFWVIWEVAHGNSSGSGSSTASNTANTGSATQASCTDSATETALQIPAVYTPTSAVTKLQTTDLTVGTGATAKAGDCVVVKYSGSLASTGKIFQETFSTTTGFAFTLGEGQVIKGWDEGVVGMKVGGTRRLVIPSSLGYGSTAQSGIPANSALVFVVKLLRIQ